MTILILAKILQIIASICTSIALILIIAYKLKNKKQTVCGTK